MSSRDSGAGFFYSPHFFVLCSLLLVRYHNVTLNYDVRSDGAHISSQPQLLFRLSPPSGAREVVSSKVSAKVFAEWPFHTNTCHVCQHHATGIPGTPNRAHIPPKRFREKPRTKLIYLRCYPTDIRVDKHRLRMPTFSCKMPL